MPSDPSRAPSPCGVTRTLAAWEWAERRSAHERRIDPLVAGHLDRGRRGDAHPVEDFLFVYYSHRPGRLRRWHPGPGVLCTGPGIEQLLGEPGWTAGPDGGAMLDPACAARRAPTARFVVALLRRTTERPARLDCFGLHEWAMVYRQPRDQVRHQAWPLRLGDEGTAAVVEKAQLRCTHFDAYRFFTAAARPRNALTPTRDTVTDLEQPGCLHATMDLYKWAYKLSPALPAELVADCFKLARDIRQLDMRASPYDLTELGYPPVRVETAAGRAEFVAAQRGFARRGAELRRQVLAAAEALLRWVGP